MKRNYFLIFAFLLTTVFDGQESAAQNRLVRIQTDAWLEIMLDEIKKKRTEVESFDPAQPNRAFEITQPGYWIHLAVSPQARQAYFKQAKANESRQSALNPAFDSLATLVAKKLPLHKPNLSIFAYRHPVGEQMVERKLKNAATLKFHKNGFEEANWLIEKNNFGLPLKHYKHGYVWGETPRTTILFAIYILSISNRMMPGAELMGKSIAESGMIR